VAGEARKYGRRKSREQWLALLPNVHDGYVSWERFERAQGMIQANSTRNSSHHGAARKGGAMLSGLLRCHRCARKLMVHYTGCQHDVARYTCQGTSLDKALPRCISFGGARVDAAVGNEVLRVVQPAAIEAAILAHRDEAKKQDEVRDALERDLQAARYSANRAQRQYDASDPENRLVTDELERRWNTAIENVREIERRIEQHCNTLREESAPTLEEFSALADQLEELWQQDDADSRLRKRIVRSLIHEVIVDVDDSAGEIVLVIHWKGNLHTEVRVPRRRRGQSSFQTAPEIVSAVRSLARICPDAFIANMLNRNGLRTGRGNFWTRERVTSLRCHHGVPVYTNDSWALIRGVNNAHGFPILLMNRYSRGIFYVLNIPDNSGDLYSLPQPVSRVIKSYLQADLPVRIDAPAQVSLFAYDNGTFVVQSFRPDAVDVSISIAGANGKLRNIVSNEMPVAEVQAAAGRQTGPQAMPRRSFKVRIAAHSYAAFAIE
jgi:hypothetical protein